MYFALSVLLLLLLAYPQGECSDESDNRPYDACNSYEKKQIATIQLTTTITTTTGRERMIITINSMIGFRNPIFWIAVGLCQPFL